MPILENQAPSTSRDYTGRRGDDGVFSGQSAWFSTSVSNKRRQAWLSNGGTEEDSDLALFFFSQKANSTDTKRLYRSEAYLDQHLAVIHAAYIDACVHQGNMKRVILGKFFLPPAHLHAAIKEQLTLEWEKYPDDEDLDDRGRPADAIDGPSQTGPAADATNGSGQTSEQARTNAPSTSQAQPSRQMSKESDDDGTSDEEGMDIDFLPQVAGDLNDFIPGQHGCEVYKK